LLKIAWCSASSACRRFAVKSILNCSSWHGFLWFSFVTRLLRLPDPWPRSTTASSEPPQRLAKERRIVESALLCVPVRWIGFTGSYELPRNWQRSCLPTTLQRLGTLPAACPRLLCHASQTSDLCPRSSASRGQKRHQPVGLPRPQRHSTVRLAEARCT